MTNETIMEMIYSHTSPLIGWCQKEIVFILGLLEEFDCGQ